MAAEVMRTPPRRRHRGKPPKSPKPETANGGRPSALRKPDGPSERLQAYLKQRKEAKAAKKMGEKDKTDEKKGKRKEDSSKKEDPEKKGAKDNKKLKKEDPEEQVPEKEVEKEKKKKQEKKVVKKEEKAEEKKQDQKKK